MSKMTSQNRATDICRTVDQGAIFELSFIYGWHKPAAAYALTPKMVEVADYTDGTFHKVIIRETGEILSTREFKRNFKLNKKPREGKLTWGKHKYSQTTGSNSTNNYKLTYYTFTYYISHNSNTNDITLTAYLNDGKEQVQVVGVTLNYTVDNWNLLVLIGNWFKTLTLTYNNPLSYNYKSKIIDFFNS